MKSLLKKVVAAEIQHHQLWVSDLKAACDFFYSKADKDTDMGPAAFKQLNKIRNQIRKEKRILRNLGNVQKAIKGIPDEYFESFGSNYEQDPTLLQAWIIGKESEIAKSVWDSLPDADDENTGKYYTVGFD